MSRKSGTLGELMSVLGNLPKDQPVTVVFYPKVIKHCLLFCENGLNDLKNAEEYIGRFLPAVSFFLHEAKLAEMVTIVGAPSGVDENAEEALKRAGCQVERLDGKDPEDTATLLRERIERNLAFEGGTFRRGY